MPSLISSHKKAWQMTLSWHVLRERGNMQAEYSQSDLSCQQLQQCLTAFQAKPVGHAAVADAQRRGILEAQAIHFLQPHSVSVSLLSMSELIQQGAMQSRIRNSVTRKSRALLGLQCLYLTSILAEVK